MRVENANARNRILGSIVQGTRKTVAPIQARLKPTAMPIKPPNMESTTLWARNCARTCRSIAPSQAYAGFPCPLGH
jgi:hypothetical protein